MESNNKIKAVRLAIEVIGEENIKKLNKNGLTVIYRSEKDKLLEVKELTFNLLEMINGGDNVG